MKERIISIVIIFLFLLSLSAPLTNSETENNPYDISEIKPLINQTGKQAYGFFPDFSPDGKEITFLCGISEKIGVWVIDSDGNNSRVIYANKSIDYNFGPPRFSPDGDKIVFIMGYKNLTTGKGEMSIDLLIKNGDSWDPSSVIHKKIYTQLWYEEGNIMFPSWSPDGKKIIFNIDFAHFYAEKEGIWTIEPDGSNLTQILRTGGADYPCYSPDGSKILYMPGGKAEIWIMNSDGSDRHKILDDSWYPDEPRFTPDGRIIFSSAKVSPHSDEVSAPSIWMMDSDGSNKVMLVPSSFGNDVYTHMPAMSPDMKKLVFSHGLASSYLYYIDDPTGEWKDSDGDGVYDGIDGAPNNPYAGYIGENPPLGMLASSIVPITVFLIIAVVAVLYILKKKGGKNENERFP